ncbi:hypothetical protein MARPU_05840 [Marichromatium purpuratum 984]|uniref:Trypsin-co-occurring domain-containing protein n=1 Tax=Marichromatium purpuratum 984 TaxID=765910 RepID=W0E2W9_MARPU|nr:hypothetical protein MARPU_05840 [Marichromatium purpuratum 984]
MPLKAMLSQLRQELIDAKAEGERKDLKFMVDDIELELQLATTQERGGGTGIKFWVLNANLKGKDTSVATQTLKLKLKAVQEVEDPATGEPSTVPAKISGRLSG